MTKSLVGLTEFSKFVKINTVNDELRQRAILSLGATTEHLRQLLRTSSFDQSVVTDQYWVNSNRRPFKDIFPKFQLSRGFVDTGASFEIKFSFLLEEIGNPGVTVVPAGQFIVEFERGIVLITGTETTTFGLPHARIFAKFRPGIHDERFAQIVYTAGFTITAGTELDVYNNVPEWLKRAAIMLGKSIYAESACKTGQKRPVQVDAIGQDLLQFVNDKIRWHPSAMQPLVTGF